MFRVLGLFRGFGLLGLPGVFEGTALAVYLMFTSKSTMKQQKRRTTDM